MLGGRTNRLAFIAALGGAAAFAIVLFEAATFALGGATLAQNTGSDAAQSSGVQLITLGTTAGPLPRKDRTQSSNALIVNGTPYLIDAGDGVARRLVQAGIDFTKIGQVFITHNHGDHTMGIPNLISVEWQYPARTRRILRTAWHGRDGEGGPCFRQCGRRNQAIGNASEHRLRRSSRRTMLAQDRFIRTATSR
jgi:Metallo-beta-lactamase superfamily